MFDMTADKAEEIVGKFKELMQLLEVDFDKVLDNLRNDEVQERVGQVFAASLKDMFGKLDVSTFSPAETAAAMKEAMKEPGLDEMQEQLDGLQDRRDPLEPRREEGIRIASREVSDDIKRTL